MLPSVRKFMKTFGVSSGTIQSVLKQLSEEGLVYSIRGKGFFWGKAPNADDLAQILSKTVHRETVMERLEKEFFGQGEYEDRTIEQTLDLGWKILAELPREELTRIKP